MSKRRVEKDRQRPGGVADYPLVDSYVHNWLVAGPCALPPSRAGSSVGSVSTKLPADPVETKKFRSSGCEMEWRYARCADDHILDLSGYYDTPQDVVAWAYARLTNTEAREAMIELVAHGPVDLWLNSEELFPEPAPPDEHRVRRSSLYKVKLGARNNHLLVRLSEAASRECPLGFALRIVPAGSVPFDNLSVRIPVYSRWVAERAAFEAMMQAAYLDREIYTDEETVLLHWLPGVQAGQCLLSARFQTPNGQIHGLAPDIIPRPDVPRYTARAGFLPDGAYQVLLLPDLRVYFGTDTLYVSRALPLYLAGAPYALAPVSSFDERCLHALRHAATHENNPFAELAKMALGVWSDVSVRVLLAATESVAEHQAGSELTLLGLLGILAEYGDAPRFPAEFKAPLEKCVLGFRYWSDEPGEDALDFASEDCQILFHACEVLAGQLYPERVFGNTGQIGHWHQAKGEQLALAWLRGHGRSGFRDWDSNHYFERDVVALSHLASLAESAELVELASVLLDKLLFSLALNSFKGTFGSTHGRTTTAAIKSGRLEPTSAIGWLMWGLGVLNDHIAGSVSLAAAGGYALPPVIASVATDQDGELWSREFHADPTDGKLGVNKVTFRTSNYMLCSAQDYQAGQAGAQEHIWQATLGPDALVFANHPADFSQSDSHRPNFWRGNGIVPRVAQWRDALIAVYSTSEEGGLDFTHAFFPVHAFEEHVLRQDWAFARWREGYVALTAAQGLSLVTAGDCAYRELRSCGRENVWLCQMGQTSVDGSFEDFQDAVLASRPEFGMRATRWTTLRHETLSFGWQGPFLVNGSEQPLSGFKPYDNRYAVMEPGASRMVIRSGDEGVVLDFS